MRRRRDYQKKDYRNPFFPKLKAKKSHRGKKFAFILIILIIIIGLYFLNASDYFTIKDIQISGNETISENAIKTIIQQQLEKRRFLFFRQSNIFFFNSRQAKKELKNNYFFEEVKIKRKFFDTLTVNVREKITAIVWLTEGKSYFLDLDGIAIKEIKAEDLVVQPGKEGTESMRARVSQEGYPGVYDQSNSPVTIGQNVINKGLADFIVKLTELINTQADFETSHYTISSPFAEQITLVTTEGWQAHFRTTNPADLQANRLFLILSQKVEDRSKLEYIDLRFEEKIFYK